MSIEDTIDDLSARLTNLENHVVGIMTVVQVAQLRNSHLIAVAIEAGTGYSAYVLPMPDGSFEVSNSYYGGSPPPEVQALVEELHSLGMRITARK